MEIITQEKQEIFKLKPIVSYNQVTTRLLLQILDKDYNGVHYPFYCKDYIQDLYFVEKFNINKFEQYKFYWEADNSYRTTDEPIGRLAFTLPNSNRSIICTAESLIWANRLINELDEILGFELSKYTLFEDHNTVVLEFDNRWGEIPYLLSLFTGIVRQLVGLDNEPPSLLEFLKNDNKYHKTLNVHESTNNGSQYYNVVKYILEGNVLPKLEWDEFYSEESSYVDTPLSSRVHNHTGILYNYDLFETNIKLLKDNDNT